MSTHKKKIITKKKHKNTALEEAINNVTRTTSSLHSMLISEETKARRLKEVSDEIRGDNSLSKQEKVNKIKGILTLDNIMIEDCYNNNIDPDCYCIISNIINPECNDPRCYNSHVIQKHFKFLTKDGLGCLYSDKYKNNNNDDIKKNFCSLNKDSELCDCINSNFMYPKCFDEKCKNNPKALVTEKISKEDCTKYNIIDICKENPHLTECSCISSNIPKPHCYDRKCIFNSSAYRTDDMKISECEDKIVICNEATKFKGNSNNINISQICGSGRESDKQNSDNKVVAVKDKFYTKLIIFVLILCIILIFITIKYVNKTRYYKNKLL